MTTPPEETSQESPQTLRLRFTDMSYGGDAVGRDPVSGVAVFAWPTITGEEASVAIRERRPNLLRGVVTEVSEASPLRTEPPCPYFGPCGGCQWQHIEYPGQVSFKHDILRSQLTRIGGIAEPNDALQPPIASPKPFGYRNTSHFAVEPGSLQLGYFQRDSHSIIAIEMCPISNAGINETISLVNSMLATSVPIETVNNFQGMMQVWKVAIRASEATGQRVVVFHTRAGGRAAPRPGRPGGSRRGGSRRTHGSHNGERPDDGPNAERPAESHPTMLLRRKDVRRAVGALAQAGVGGQPLALTAVEVMADGTINLLGQTRAAAALVNDAIADSMTGTLLKRVDDHPDQGVSSPLGAWVERLDGRLYWVAPEGFFQANTQAAELLFREIARWVPKQVDLLVDAHAGVGAFALGLAGRVGHVVGFEVDSAAVAAARWTALMHGTRNAEFAHGRAEMLMPRLAADVKPDVVVLDPPRGGCGPQLLTEIARREAPRIIYVSCDPSTLSRDIKALSGSYTLTSARVVDMFPQTFHIETVAVLDRR